MELDEVLATFGLDVPRVFGVNLAAEWVKHELERLGYWQRVRKVGFLLPLGAAIVFCLLSGEEGVGALRCGVAYGLAAIALHEFDSSMK